jgi:DNA-binding transcriptional LysR family regulator
VDLLLHLKTFVSVAEELSFSRAADELAIAQPLLSRRIKSLEEFLGGELFDRARRQIQITDLGVVLLPHARELLARSDQLLDAVRAARGTSAIRLAMPADCDPRALAALIRAAAEHGFVLRIKELPAAERAAALANGSVTAALVPTQPELASIRVPLGLAAAEPLTSRGRPVQLDMLRRRRGTDDPATTLFVTGEDAGAPVRQAAARAGLAEDALRLGVSPAAALAETLAGHGVLLCDERFAGRHDVPWVPLADGSVCRGYEVAGAPDWLVPLFGAAVGAGAPPPPARATDLMLTARG